MPARYFMISNRILRDTMGPISRHWTMLRNVAGCSPVRDTLREKSDRGLSGRKAGRRSRCLVQLSLRHPDVNRCFQAHRQSPLLSFFKGTSEVRVLFLHRSYPASTVI